MQPHQRAKRFGDGGLKIQKCHQSQLLGYCARKWRGYGLDKNPYRQGTDDYKRWKKGWRLAKRGRMANRP